MTGTVLDDLRRRVRVGLGSPGEHRSVLTELIDLRLGED